MSPATSRLEADLRGFPRVSGDEPAPAWDSAEARQFSPRERG